MSRKNIAYDKPKSPFVRSRQKKMDEDMICDCVARINEDACVRNRCLESLVEFNGYDSKNQILYLQGIALQGLILKQRKSRRENGARNFT